MSSLHGTQATFDPLSAPDNVTDEAFTTVYDSPSEYQSFMTAPSAMSYMTASHDGTASSMAAATPSAPPPPSPPPAAAAAAAPSSLFRRLPDRAPPPPPSLDPFREPEYGNPFASNQQQSQLPQPPPLQPLQAAAHEEGSNNPFAAAAPSPYYTPPPPAAAPPATAAMGPLSFGDDDGAAQTAAAFAMPLDLYDTPDAFAPPQPVPPRPQAAAAAAAGAAPLPPLYEFAREFSRMLPVSEDPVSPVGVSVDSGAAWYDNGGGGGSSGPGSGPSAVGAASGKSVTAGGGGGGSGSGGFTSYAAAALLTNTVSVHSPRKAVAPSRIPGLSEPYMSYRVTSRSAISPETTVERRFRDVVALAELLQSLHPGCFLPPRPSRNAVEGRWRMQAGFIEERRAGIEKFLRRLVVHPVLGPSEATQVWLHSASSPDLRSNPDWIRLQPTAPPGLAKSTARLLFQVVGRERTVPSPLDVTRPASERGDVYRLVHERAAQMRGVMGRVQPSPIEEKLRQEAAALQDRTEALLSLSRKADVLVSRSAKGGRAGGKVAAAMAAGAEVEAAAAAAAGGPAAALRVAAEGFEKVSKLYGIATDASAKHLTPLHDWLAAVPGCTAALAARERCLLTVATLEADEAEARARLAEAEARIGGGGGGGGAASQPTAAMKKVESVRLQVSQLVVALTAARDEYERVGARNASELAAFKAQMSRELADAVREYALVQLAAAQKAHDIWSETAGKLTTLAAAAAAAACSTGGGGAVAGGSGAAVGGGIGSGGGMYGGMYGS
ncbi:hypothetical protein PLESTB_001293500 [Pleodorina starrii]|uniref:PX domain-containing protein n=1 Tax=Pleodorina starrii TaxID=330485 RepID=A0A9W6BUC2_9CHLO|nr:hypothetical protein PLESTM_000955500 [Pleodorina starrii]GLC57952.1 hypothetical protein PLESTB_001293500 [Pleodorina starrii]GLC67048.1 hypothetical protein PLESTF_000509100 [Pleodorina starrii]